MRPVVRGNYPIDCHGDNIQYHEYSDARGELIGRIGEYCSYCEMQLDSALAVEHIQPKKPRGCTQIDSQREMDWNNFLLACPNCNSTKGNTDVVLDDYLWPDRDNTFRALKYSEGGIITPALQGEMAHKAQNTIHLFGLDKMPSIITDMTDMNYKNRASDRRWNNRREAWDNAERAKKRLSQNDIDELREQIVETAQANGYWSIWMTVFEDDPDMCRRLIEAFPGTCKDCFDANQGYKTVKRQGGQC